MLLMSVFSFLITLTWKWKKFMLMIILMETFSVVFLSMTLTFLGGVFYFFLLMVSFFVSESLVLLSSFYCSMRFSGNVSSVLTI